jgi:hypothetical protein
VSVQGLIELTDPDGIAVNVVSGNLNVSLPIVVSPNDLARIISPADLWQGGPNEFLKAIQRHTITRGGQALQCRLHTEFWHTLGQSTIYTNADALDKLCRICSLVLTEQARDINVDLRPLRATDAANSPQRVRSRDGAKAWRLTITDGGIGWRLQYWHIPARGSAQLESIELANVLRKHDPERIPE